MLALNHPSLLSCGVGNISIVFFSYHVWVTISSSNPSRCNCSQSVVFEFSVPSFFSWFKKLRGTFCCKSLRSISFSILGNYSLIATINHSGTLNRRATLLVGYKFLILKKVLSTMPPHTFFITEKCNFFPGSTEIYFARGFYFGHCLWV